MGVKKYNLLFLVVLCVGVLLPNVSARARPDDFESDEYDYGAIIGKSEEVQAPAPVQPAPVVKDNSDSFETSVEVEVKPQPPPAQPVQPAPPVPAAKDSFEVSEEEVIKPQPPAPVVAQEDNVEASEEEVKPQPPAPIPVAKDSFEASEEEEVKPQPPPPPPPAAVQPSPVAAVKDSFEESEEEVKPQALAPLQTVPVPAAHDSVESSLEEDKPKAVAQPPVAVARAQPMAAQPMAAQPMAAQPMAAQPMAAQPLPESQRYTALKDSADEEDWSSEESAPAPPAAAPAPVSAPSAPAPAQAPSTSGDSHHLHHLHHTHKHTTHEDTEIVNNAQPVPTSFGSGTPVVHVEFNQSCGFTETTGRCDPGRNMECSTSTNKCICKSSLHVYVPGARQCLQVSSRASSYSCTYNEQCHSADSLGPLSVCNTDVGRCECIKTASGPPVVVAKDKCVYQKFIGDGCPDDKDDVCEATITNSICIYRPKETTEPSLTVIDLNATMVCLCENGYVYDPALAKPEECLIVGNIEGANCKIDKQCTSGLGPYSRCFANACQCADVVEFNGEAVFHKGTCYKRVNLGDVCKSDDQCKASIHDNAVCVERESYMAGEKACHCPEGLKCDGNGATGSSAPSTIILLVNFVIMAFGATKVLY